MHKTELVLAFLVAAVLAGVLLRFTGREGFMQKDVGMPLDAPGIGPYDGVSMGGGVSGWQASEPAPVPVAPASTPDEQKQMLMVGNEVSHSCCPSSFNTDTGCVCLTPQDKSLFASRGGNR